MPKTVTTKKKGKKNKGITCTVYDADNPLTCAKAKEMLGWRVVEEGDFILKDTAGNKVFCENNQTNRPVQIGNVRRLKQEIAHNNWHLNGETFIFGEHGNVLEGQHTLIAFILCCEEYRQDPDSFPDWEAEPVLYKLVVEGVSEDDATVNTINTGKPRTFADVVYRSAYFADMGKADRKKSAKVCDYAIRYVWDRTGVQEQPYSPLRTHTEMIDFLERHPGIMSATRYMVDLNSDKLVQDILPVGTAAGMLYLMSMCSTAPEEYFTGDKPTEATCDVSHKDKAEEFWDLFINGDTSLKAIRKGIAETIPVVGPCHRTTAAVIALAWDKYRQDIALRINHVRPKFTAVEDPEFEIPELVESYTVGGIDVDGQYQPIEIEEEPEISETEVKKRAKKIRKEKQAAKRSGKITVGSTIWVVPTDDPSGSWKGTVRELTGNQAAVEVSAGFSYAGSIEVVDLSEFSLEWDQPEV